MKYLAVVSFVFTSFVFAHHQSSGGTIQITHDTTTEQTPATTTTTTTPPPTPLPVTAEEQQWDTVGTDPTAYWPTTTSPIATLPLAIQEKFACIRYVESRNHVRSVSYAGAGGLYQFMPFIWRAFGGLVYAPLAQLATPQQQDQVAVNVYNANKGFAPEWQNDCTSI
jgi:hypothetical protein